MKGVDLRTFRFDYDLTFAALLMHPDGTVYHRYGGRDAGSAMARMSLPSFVRFLRDGLATHREYSKRPAPPQQRKRHTMDDMPVWAKSLRQQRSQGCYHCHFVYEAQMAQRVADGKWARAQVWRWPPPERIGLQLGRDRQTQIAGVTSGSAAARAGLRKGDVLRRAGKQRLLTQADLSWVLEQRSPGAVEVPLEFSRKGKVLRATLRLAKGWRTGTAREFAWRPSKWPLRPRPGFGGKELGQKEKAALGLDPKRFAMRVGYLTTWRRNPLVMGVPRIFAGSRRYGLAAKRAGLRTGDVIVSVGKARLESLDHLHAWWRLTRRPGETVEVVVLRGKEQRTLRVQVPR